MTDIPTEIEKRFLPANDAWQEEIEEWIQLKQGYITLAPNMVRVRAQKTSSGNTSYKLEAKGNRTGLVVQEPWVKLAGDQYHAFAALCGDRWIQKRRGIISNRYHPLEIHIDIFEGALAPLIIIEVEFPSLQTAENSDSNLLPWLGEEITERFEEYSNSSLATQGLPEHFTHWCFINGTDLPAIT